MPCGGFPSRVCPAVSFRQMAAVSPHLDVQPLTASVAKPQPSCYCFPSPGGCALAYSPREDAANLLRIEALARIPVMQRMNVYADESRIQAERYMLIGGLWLPASEEPALRERLAAFRSSERMTAELKWTKVSAGKLEAYKKLVDIFCDHKDVTFNCIVVDVSILDHATYSKGDSELGFYKFYFHLLSRRVRPDCEYYVRTDHRINRQANRLADLQLCTNRWCAKRSGFRAKPIRSIEARDSSAEDLIQLTDVILGAVGYACNKRGESGAKLELIGHLAKRLKLGSLSTPCAPYRAKFNSWHWSPHQKTKKRPDS